MTYEEFKKEFRGDYPNAPCRLIKEMHELVYPETKDTIASCKPAMPTQEYLNMLNSDYWVEPNKQEGQTPMCYKCKSQDFTVTSVIGTSAPISIEATQRDFATSRVNQIREKHDEKLRLHFFMDSEDGPRTARDLIKAIKEDAFRLDEKKLAKMEDELKYYNAFFGIDWGKNKPDVEGFEVARQALKEESQEVIDKVTLGTIEEARQALDAFKNWTYSA